MVEIIVGLFIITLAYYGFRDGLAKTLGSIAMLFVALFLSSSAIAALGKIAAEFNNPKSLLTIIVFFLLWLALYIALDLLIKLILRVVVQITVLGPLDQVGGVLLGAVRGMLVAGIALQFMLSFPVSDKTKVRVLSALPAKFSIATFQWVYPAAQKMQPYLNGLINLDDKSEVIENITIRDKVSGEVEGIIKEKVPALDKAAREQEKRFRQLLEGSDLSPTSPSGRPR
jgi:uncharacterized membrane protein required for colicin V production